MTHYITNKLVFARAIHAFHHLFIHKRTYAFTLRVRLPPPVKHGVGIEIQAHDNVVAANIAEKRNIVSVLHDFTETAQSAGRIEVVFCGYVVSVLGYSDVQFIQLGHAPCSQNERPCRFSPLGDGYADPVAVNLSDYFVK